MAAGPPAGPEQGGGRGPQNSAYRPPGSASRPPAGGRTLEPLSLGTNLSDPCVPPPGYCRLAEPGGGGGDTTWDGSAVDCSCSAPSPWALQWWGGGSGLAAAPALPHRSPLIRKPSRVPTWREASLPRPVRLPAGH